jgi:hypothetical protein
MRQRSVFDNCGFELVLIFIAVLNAVTNDATETSPALSRVFLQQSMAEGTLDERFVLIEVGFREYQMCQARVPLRRAPADGLIVTESVLASPPQTPHFPTHPTAAVCPADRRFPLKSCVR